MKMDRRTLLFGSPAFAVGAVVTPSARAIAQAEDSPSPNGLPAGAASRFAQINGIRLHFVEMGQGPVLILLHGWPQTWFAWRGVMPRLAARFRVVAPDLRGTGLSERTPSGYDKRTIAEDICALIASLGVGQAHVAAHDMGGKAAYFLAHLHPEVVSKLALVDCLLPGTENLDALRGGAWHYGFHMAPETPEMLTKGRERDYIRAQIKAWSHSKDAIGEDAITEYASHYGTPGGMTAGFNFYRALRDDVPFAATLRNQKLTMPVMAIAGRYGVGEQLADALRPETRDLASVIAPDSGHFVAEEAPDFFCEHLERFLIG
jgi:pimeloyl-ACP methyl ester carboxylesterase